MNTPTTSYHSKSQPADCAHAPCEIGPSCRPAYYAGKLLTENDFNLEQQYHIDRQRSHNVAMHGWGVVCGLEVIPHPRCPAQRVVVTPGLAIDSCGREICLLEPAEIVLPQLPAPQPPDPCPPYESDPRPPHEAHERLWLCLRYCEMRTELAPCRPFDECNCGGAPMKPNRVCESFCVDVVEGEHAPECFKEHHAHHDCDEDCREIYEGAQRHCAQPGDVACIPLAVIHHFARGKAVVEEDIDNRSHRPTLPSVHTLDRLIRCILEKLPTRRLTRITDMNWTHGERLHCNELIHRFVEHDNGFIVTFGDRVPSKGINARSFQAMVVYRSGPRANHVEVAPAEVDRPGGDETRCRLRIDPGYAHRLQEHDFDLFITLKCDVILDHRGLPVDGNLLARLGENGNYTVDAPTGDGVPGGLFQSWLRIHHEHHPHDD